MLETLDQRVNSAATARPTRCSARVADLGPADSLAGIPVDPGHVTPRAHLEARLREPEPRGVGPGIVATISNAFSLADVNPFYQDIVKGCIIVGALAFDVYARRLAGRVRAPSW